MDIYVLIPRGDWSTHAYRYAAKVAYTWCLTHSTAMVRLLDRSRTLHDVGPFYLVFRDEQDAMMFKLSVDRDQLLIGLND